MFTYNSEMTELTITQNEISEHLMFKYNSEMAELTTQYEISKYNSEMMRSKLVKWFCD